MNIAEQQYADYFGRLPDDETKLRLMKIMQTLDIKADDPVFALLLVLDYYKELYGVIPDRITEKANEAGAALIEATKKVVTDAAQKRFAELRHEFTDTAIKEIERVADRARNDVGCNYAAKLTIVATLAALFFVAIGAVGHLAWDIKTDNDYSIIRRLKADNFFVPLPQGVTWKGKTYVAVDLRERILIPPKEN